MINIKHINKIFIIVVISTISFMQPLFSQWQQVNLPPMIAGTFWLDVYFLESDTNYGWVCGYGMTARTTDAGKTWTGTPISDGMQLESIHFSSRNIGYTSGLGYNRPGVIYKTTDGGVSWFDITPFNNQAGLWGNFFINDRTGLVIGGGCGDYQYFWRTTDGGMSWYAFIDDEFNSGLTDLEIYEENGLGYATSSGKIWITEDGGRKWRVFKRSGDADWQEEIAIRGKTILVPYSPPCTGGSPGGMRVSRDMGNTWNQYYTDRPMFGSFLHDSLRGWSCGHKGGVYQTFDAGRTWQLRNCGLNGADMDDIWFINDTLGFVVGNGIYRYNPLQDYKPEIAGLDTLNCIGSTITLTTTLDYPHYRWSTGDTTKSITVDKPGSYWVIVFADSCSQGISTKFNIYSRSRPEMTITNNGPQPLCEGDTLIITLTGQYSNVVTWEDGSKGDSYTAYQSDIIGYSFTDDYGCFWQDSIKIEFLPNPKPNVLRIGRKTPCVGDSVFLVANEGFSRYDWYDEQGNLVSSGSGNSLIVKKDGRYYVRTTNINGCTNLSDSIAAAFRLDTNALEFFIEENPPIVQFDSVRYPDIKCVKLTIRNLSWKDYTIENLIILRNTLFSIPQSQMPLKIPPFSSKEIEVCFHALKMDTQRDTLVLPDICSEHKVPLVAYGIEKLYYGTARCEVPLRIINDGSWIYEFYGYDPYPLPASDELIIPYGYKSESNFKLQIKCRLINQLGDILLETNESEVSPTNISGLHEGIFRLKVSEFPTGVYLVELITMGESIHYPIIISH
jgi:hypothetical protein